MLVNKPYGFLLRLQWRHCFKVCHGMWKNNFQPSWEITALRPGELDGWIPYSSSSNTFLNIGRGNFLNFSYFLHKITKCSAQWNGSGQKPHHGRIPYWPPLRSTWTYFHSKRPSNFSPANFICTYLFEFWKFCGFIKNSGKSNF